jgi:hypothetical protein
MSMLRRIGLICALALLAASVATAQPGKLNVISGSQFVVRGTAFKPHEHVLVVVTAAGQHGSKRLSAGPGGAFVARFPSIDIGSCAAFTVRATGDRGSHAGLRVMPECPQPVTP